MQYANKSFTVSLVSSAYAEGWERIFGRGQEDEGDPYCLPDRDGVIACPKCREVVGLPLRPEDGPAQKDEPQRDGS